MSTKAAPKDALDTVTLTLANVLWRFSMDLLRIVREYDKLEPHWHFSFGKDNLSCPWHVAFHPITRQIVVADKSGVLVFDASGKWIRKLDGVVMPSGLTISPMTGDIYVGDEKTYTIQRYRSHGEALGELKSILRDQLVRRGTIPMAAHRDKVFLGGDPTRIDELTCERDLGDKTDDLDTVFDFNPRHLNGMRNLTVRSDGTLFWTNSNRQIQRWNPLELGIVGRRKISKKSLAFVDAPGELRGLYFDHRGHLLVCDWTFHCVRAFDESGALLFVCKQTGEQIGPGKLQYPHDVCVDHQEGVMYVCDGSDQVHVFVL